MFWQTPLSRGPSFLRKPNSKSIECSVVLAAAIVFAAPLQSYAQFAMDDGGGGTIDIQANEQEFANDHVIARGNVHVVYKDSIIDAPMATLYKDAAGKPTKAIFTGHPRLKQGSNRIDADTLTFEMASAKIIADGNAHSEVIPDNASDATKASQKISGKAAGKTKTAVAKTTEPNETNPDEQSSENVAKDPASEETAAKAASSGPSSPFGGPATNKPQEKIVTDSDRQEYNRTTGQFDAIGNVRVKHGDIFVQSARLKLVYDADKKPETALFTGNVKATQNKNRTEADVMTYFLTTKRLQATGNVKSTVVQAKQAETTKKGGLFSRPPAAASKVAAAVDGDAQAAVDAVDGGIKADKPEEPIIIFSDAQDYSETTGRVTADGNVKLFYQDSIGVAPKMVLVKNLQTGQTEHVYLSGRCQITQPGKRWIADRITYSVQDNMVLAEGNTKAIILSKPAAPGSGETQLAGTSPKSRTATGFSINNTAVAQRKEKAASRQEISASKVKPIQ